MRKYIIFILVSCIIFLFASDEADFGEIKLNTGSYVSEISTDTTLATNADTTLVTEKAIKTYVDTEITAQDLDIAGDTGTGAVDLDSQTLTVAGTANETVTAVSGQTVTISLPDTVTVTALNTGHGDNELYAMDQDVESTDNVEFADIVNDSTYSRVIKLAVGTDVNEFSTDGTLAGDSDTAVPTEKAVKTYVDAIDLTGYVPYTGADSTLDMGDEDIIVDTLKSLSLHEVSPEGLVLGMNFNTETINGSTVYDASFYGNNGTIYNATPDSSAGFNSGGAITFTGTDTSYVEIADDVSLDMTEAITLMAWAKDPPAWLTGWDYRRKITVDATNIDATLTDFPLLIHLSSSCGLTSQDLTGIFTRITTNSKKIALTTDDGTTQCYVEIEEWDNASQEAWLWARIPSIATGTDTELYLYYDSSQADNTTYIGDTNSTVADSVWNDSKFVAVYHMADGASTSAIYDSSPNNNDGTKAGANEPIEYAGELDGSQDFDGTDDNITTGDCADALESFSLRFYNDNIINKDTQYPFIIYFYDDANNQMSIGFGAVTSSFTNEIITFLGFTDGDLPRTAYTSATASIAIGWHSLTIFRVIGGYYEIWLDNVKVNNANAGAVASQLPIGVVKIGSNNDKWYFDGKITDVKLYNTIITGAYQQSDYYNLEDSLNTFGVEVVNPVAKNIFDKTAYGAYVSVADSSFSGFINDEIVKYSGTDILSYRLYTMTYDKTNIILYLDGVQVATQAYTTAISANDSTLTIGKSFTGEIDDVQIYNRALSADEIWSAYARRVEVHDPFVWQGGDAHLGTLTADSFPDSLVTTQLTVIGTANEVNVVSLNDIATVGLVDSVVVEQVDADTIRAGKVLLDSTALLSTPQAGMIEYSNDKYYITNTNRQTVIDRSCCVLDSTCTVVNSSDTTIVYTGRIGANRLRAGNYLKLHADGVITNSNASEDIRIMVWVGDDEVISFKPELGNISDAHWHMDGNMTVRTIGSSGTMAYHLDMEIDENADENIGTASINTEIAENFTIKVCWDAADAGNSFSIYQGITEWKN